MAIFRTDETLTFIYLLLYVVELVEKMIEIGDNCYCGLLCKAENIDWNCLIFTLGRLDNRDHHPHHRYIRGFESHRGRAERLFPVTILERLFPTDCENTLVVNARGQRLLSCHIDVAAEITFVRASRCFPLPHTVPLFRLASASPCCEIEPRVIDGSRDVEQIIGFSFAC